MSIGEIANTQGIKNPSQISLWQRSYEKEGVAELQRKRGRPRLNRTKDLSKKNTKPSEKLRVDEKGLPSKEPEYELRLAKIKNEYVKILGRLEQKHVWKR